MTLLTPARTTFLALDLVSTQNTRGDHVGRAYFDTKTLHSYDQDIRRSHALHRYTETLSQSGSSKQESVHTFVAEHITVNLVSTGASLECARATHSCRE